MPRQTYYCIACEEYFPSQKALDNHNTKLREQGVLGHVQCQQCVYIARDEKDRALHMRSAHPVIQSLVCPACKQGPYPSIPDFVHHIEKGKCGVLTLDKIDDMRRELVLPSRAISAAQGFQQRDDFSEYFGLDRHKVFPSQKLSETAFIYDWDTWTPDGATQAQPPTEVWPLDDKVFNNGPQLDSNGKPRNPDLEYDEWGQPILPEGEDDEPVPYCFLPPWKNLQPGATVVDCWNEDLGMYKCPCYKPNICLKVLSTADELIRHIKAKHNERVYRCPGCMKGYQSLESFAGHTTSYGKACKFRRNDLFDHFIEQLVGGMIVADRARNEDGTRNFRISDRALKQFGKRVVPGSALVNDSEAIKSDQPKQSRRAKKRSKVQSNNGRRDEAAVAAQRTDPDDDLMAEDIDWDEWDKTFEIKGSKIPAEEEENCNATGGDEAKATTDATPEPSQRETVRIPKPPRFENLRISEPPRQVEAQAQTAEKKVAEQKPTAAKIWANAVKNSCGDQVSQPVAKQPAPLAQNNRRKNNVMDGKTTKAGTSNGAGVGESSQKGGKGAWPRNQNGNSGSNNGKSSPKNGQSGKKNDPWAWRKAQPPSQAQSQTSREVEDRPTHWQSKKEFFW